MSKKTGSSHTLGIVVVAYKNEQHIDALIDALASQTKAGDKVVVVDNYYPGHPCARHIEGSSGVDVILRLNNVGFGGGCNAGAAAIIDDVDLLLFLNPDTVPLPGSLDALRSGGKPEWGGWMGLLTLPDGTVNSAGNAVHISGLSWVNGYGVSPANYTQPRSVAVLSGADMVVRASAWKRIGGFEADYFLYYEDTDISIRLRLLGYGLGLVPTAHIQHDYDFGKGSHKWFYIERNRYVFMLICWPLSVLLVLSPLLIVNELGLWAVSVIQRRFWSKVRASFSLLPMLPWIATKRRTAQKSRKISSADFMKLLEPRVDTPLLGSMPAFINALFVYYYRIALKLLG